MKKIIKTIVVYNLMLFGIIGFAYAIDFSQSIGALVTNEEIKSADFSNQKLDEELRQLCENLVLKLGRKREVPFIRGKIEIWAAAVVHLIASLNFLFDKSTENYISIADICKFFDVKSSSMTN